MCDYSLHAVSSRPARVGDELMTTRFANSATRGFCAVGEPDVAVCLLPGCELAFKEDTEIYHPFGRLFSALRFGKVGHKVARFRKINGNRSDAHHDALEFANGKIVLVTRLRPGQRATVLQLPVQARNDAQIQGPQPAFVRLSE
jgi:hypothetical protein